MFRFFRFSLVRRSTFACGAVLLLCQCQPGGDPAQQVENLSKSLYKFNPQKPVHGQFSGLNSLKHVEAQVAFGPRPAGSPELEKCRDYLTSEMQKNGWEVQRQEFSDYTPKGNVKFVNLRARFTISGSETWKRNSAVLLASHYDTKLFTTFRFVGANDAGSSTGALVEMSRVLAAAPDLAQFIELVFFDGEEAVVNYDQSPGKPLPSDGLYGSRHYANGLKKLPRADWPLYFILLDMIGEQNVRITFPDGSNANLVAALKAAAAELGHSGRFGSTGAIVDDHLPFQLLPMPVVDVIDLDYSVWHTQADTLERLSAESLELVGQTVLLAIEKHLLNGK
jgi:glutaminyl-peptide cyclotransferase